MVPLLTSYPIYVNIGFTKYERQHNLIATIGTGLPRTAINLELVPLLMSLDINIDNPHQATQPYSKFHSNATTPHPDFSVLKISPLLSIHLTQLS